MTNLETTLHTLVEALGTSPASWTESLSKTSNSKNITIGEWNSLVWHTGVTYQDIFNLYNAIRDVVSAIGNTGEVPSEYASIVGYLNAQKISLEKFEKALDNLTTDVYNELTKKLDRIVLDENGNGADPTNAGEDASKYSSIGTYSGVYVEHMGSNGKWRPMLRRLNAGDDVSALTVDHIPISDSTGRIRVTAPDGSVSDTDFASANAAIPRHYADSRYVRTIDSTSTVDRAYIRTSGGSNSNRPISAGLTDGTASIPIRDRTSQNFHVGPTTKNNHPINATQLVSRLSLEFDKTNYVMSLVYNAPEKVNGNTRVVLGTIDLPMESVVVSGYVSGDYLNLKLVNGEEVSIQIDHIIDPIYDEVNAVRADLVELQEFVTFELGDVLDEIIALQGYYTGATFDELHEYATNVAEGGTQ